MHPSGHHSILQYYPKPGTKSLVLFSNLPRGIFHLGLHHAAALTIIGAAGHHANDQLPDVTNKMAATRKRYL
jgi:hypothetical protein